MENDPFNHLQQSNEKLSKDVLNVLEDKKSLQDEIHLLNSEIKRLKFENNTQQIVKNHNLNVDKIHDIGMFASRNGFDGLNADLSV